MRKSTLRIICLVLAVVVGCGALAYGTGLLKLDEDKAYENFGKKVNENNLYTVSCMTLTDRNDGSGIIVNVDERTGAITLDGKYNGDGAMDISVGSVDLKAGTYTLTACDRASLAGIYVTITANGIPYEFDFTPGNTVDITGDFTNCEIKIHVAEGTELNNVKILPVIVPGDEAESFYK